jgi:carbamate kinase
MGPDGGGYRRLVASPSPRRIVELATIRLLASAGHVLVCAGGGGIPVTLDTEGAMRGVEAVVDKDHVSALLARELEADGLLLLTDEPAVWSAWPRERGRAIRSASPTDLAALDFEPGSMGPKVEAACDFVGRTGKPAAIGALEDAVNVIAGHAGTAIRVEAGLEFYDASFSAS